MGIGFAGYVSEDTRTPASAEHDPLRERAVYHWLRDRGEDLDRVLLSRDEMKLNNARSRKEDL